MVVDRYAMVEHEALSFEVSLGILFEIPQYPSLELIHLVVSQLFDFRDGLFTSDTTGAVQKQLLVSR
jgi:hypothetical protein